MICCGEYFKECETFDLGSTVTLLKHQSKVKNIRAVVNKVTIVSNGGNTRLDKKADWKEWGKSYLCDIAMTNILFVSNAVNKGFRVLFDSEKENCFYVVDRKTSDIIQFPHNEGLYVRIDAPIGLSHVTSVEGFTDRKVKRATAARKFLHNLSAESVENVKFFIRSNQAKNVPISTENMQLAEKVFGTMYLYVKESGPTESHL